MAFPVDPELLAEVEAQVDAGQVVKAWSSTTMWRGIETILAGRDLARTHEYSLLVVHDREGKAEKQYTYGRHPRKD